LGDGFEGEVLGFFGGEEEATVGGEFGGGGRLDEDVSTGILFLSGLED
jgi:hypothetical protein